MFKQNICYKREVLIKVEIGIYRKISNDNDTKTTERANNQADVVQLAIFLTKVAVVSPCKEYNYDTLTW